MHYWMSDIVDSVSEEKRNMGLDICILLIRYEQRE